MDLLNDTMYFLNEVYYNFRKHGMYVPVNASGKLFTYYSLNDSEKEDLIVYINKNYSIELVFRSEFEELKKSFKVDDSNMKLEINGDEKIQRIANIVDDYYITADYKRFLENFLNELEEKKELKK